MSILGGIGIAAILAARGRAGFAAAIGFGGATRGFNGGGTFGALTFFAALGTGGAGARIDGAGGGGTVRSLGGLALGSAATFWDGMGALIFGGAGTLGGGFKAATGAFDGAGFGFAITGGGTRRKGGRLGAALTSGASRGLAAIFGAGRAGAGITGGGRWRAVVGLGGGDFAANSAGRFKVERGGVAGGGSSAAPGLGDGTARGVRSSDGTVGCGPSLSSTLRSTITLGRLEPGE